MQKIKIGAVTISDRRNFERGETVVALVVAELDDEIRHRTGDITLTTQTDGDLSVLLSGAAAANVVESILAQSEDDGAQLAIAGLHFGDVDLDELGPQVTTDRDGVAMTGAEVADARGIDPPDGIELGSGDTGMYVDGDRTDRFALGGADYDTLKVDEVVTRLSAEFYDVPDTARAQLLADVDEHENRRKRPRKGVLEAVAALAELEQGLVAPAPAADDASIGGGDD